MAQVEDSVQERAGDVKESSATEGGNLTRTRAAIGGPGGAPVNPILSSQAVVLLAAEPPATTADLTMDGGYWMLGSGPTVYIPSPDSAPLSTLP